jgi:hypothetical protein
LFAFSVAAIGFASAILASKLYSLHHESGAYITPGVNFGLVTSLWWLLREQWFRKREAVILPIGATVAYAAAWWATFFGFLFLSSAGKAVPPALKLGEAGIIGGAAGTTLLGGALALTSRKFLSSDWSTFFVIGTGTGAALALGRFGEEQQIPNLGNSGTRLFVFLWQFAVAAYLRRACSTSGTPTPRAKAFGQRDSDGNEAAWICAKITLRQPT